MPVYAQRGLLRQSGCTESAPLCSLLRLHLSGPTDSLWTATSSRAQTSQLCRLKSTKDTSAWPRCSLQIRQLFYRNRVKLFLKQMQQGSLRPVPTSMTRSHMLERRCSFVVNIDSFFCLSKRDNDRRTVCSVPQPAELSASVNPRTRRLSVRELVNTSLPAQWRVLQLRGERGRRARGQAPPVCLAGIHCGIFTWNMSGKQTQQQALFYCAVAMTVETSVKELSLA